MDAIAAHLSREVGPVVQQEGNVALNRQRAQALTGAPYLIVAGVFQAQLYAGDIARIEHLGQLPGEGVEIKARRRNQIEAAGGVDYSLPL